MKRHDFLVLLVVAQAAPAMVYLHHLMRNAFRYHLDADVDTVDIDALHAPIHLIDGFDEQQSIAAIAKETKTSEGKASTKKTKRSTKKLLRQPKSSTKKGGNNNKPSGSDSAPLQVDQPDKKKTLHPIQTKDKVEPYDINDVLSVVDVYGSDIAIVIYDPKEDTFLSYTPKYHVKGRFVTNIIPKLTNALRQLFPDRFNTDAGNEVALAVVSDDYPIVFDPATNECMQENIFKKTDESCAPKNVAPILQFGSVFKSPILSSMVHMPPPAAYLFGCFNYWLKNGEVCKFYMPKPPNKRRGFLLSGENLDIGWDDLINQVVWRGTDMAYLPLYLNLRSPKFDSDVEPKIEGVKPKDVNSTATRAMKEVYDELVPRWQGVVWTAEAEREAEKNPGSLPWANLKFNAGWNGTDKVDVKQDPYYVKLNDHGIPCIGESMALAEVAKYKYHIDLGGNGGTTGGGTLEKLGLPGLLFHHETPTFDYIHKWMEPWVHYVPIKSDLSDLKEKYKWAEQNQDNAKEISAAATSLARRLGTNEGMDALFHEIFQDPLGRVIDAYQPVAKGTWQDVLERKKWDYSSADTGVPNISCKRDDHLHCFLNENPSAKNAAAKCSAKDAEYPSHCKKKKSKNM